MALPPLQSATVNRRFYKAMLCHYFCQTFCRKRFHPHGVHDPTRFCFASLLLLADDMSLWTSTSSMESSNMVSSTKSTVCGGTMRCRSKTVLQKSESSKCPPLRVLASVSDPAALGSGEVLLCCRCDWASMDVLSGEPSLDMSKYSSTATGTAIGNFSASVMTRCTVLHTKSSTRLEKSFRSTAQACGIIRHVKRLRWIDESKHDLKSGLKTNSWSVGESSSCSCMK
mmetsp:Transcript_11853/g.30269  ORF Transcript_11853/g.30269 Transcript_11853/m.30269 type:complete len:227 (+) Transcript_11853:1605-2285(+)